jgi:hypothetical protein
LLKLPLQNADRRVGYFAAPYLCVSSNSARQEFSIVKKVSFGHVAAGCSGGSAIWKKSLNHFTLKGYLDVSMNGNAGGGFERSPSVLWITVQNQVNAALGIALAESHLTTYRA